MMSETPEERRERLLVVIRVALGPSDVERQHAATMAPAVLDGLLGALEPPLVGMVRQGIEERAPRVHHLDYGSVSPFGFTWYHPAP
jgi:hypothetical protein